MCVGSYRKSTLLLIIVIICGFFIVDLLNSNTSAEVEKFNESNIVWGDSILTTVLHYCTENNTVKIKVGNEIFVNSNISDKGNNIKDVVSLFSKYRKDLKVHDDKITEVIFTLNEN